MTVRQKYRFLCDLRPPPLIQRRNGCRRRGVSFSSQDEEIRSTITVRNKIRRKRFAGRDKTGVDIAERNRRGRSRFFSSEIKFNFVQILYIRTREKFANQLLRDREGKRLARKIRATYGQIDGRPLQLRRNSSRKRRI